MSKCSNCGDHGVDLHAIEIIPFDGENVLLVDFCKKCLTSVDAWCNKHGPHPSFQFLSDESEASFSMCFKCAHDEINSMSENNLKDYFKLIRNGNQKFFEAYSNNTSEEFTDGPLKDEKNLMFYIANFARIRKLTTMQAFFVLIEEGSGKKCTIQ